jgi:hypothetical protein
MDHTGGCCEDERVLLSGQSAAMHQASGYAQCSNPASLQVHCSEAVACCLHGVDTRGVMRQQARGGPAAAAALACTCCMCQPSSLGSWAPGYCCCCCCCCTMCMWLPLVGAGETGDQGDDDKTGAVRTGTDEQVAVTSRRATNIPITWSIASSGHRCDLHARCACCH